MDTAETVTAKSLREVQFLFDSNLSREIMISLSETHLTEQEKSTPSTLVKDFDILVEKVEELPTLYSIDLVNMDTCKNELLLEDIRQYGREI